MMSDLTVKAYKKAVQVLRECSHATGMKASARERGYPQVWARDSMVTLLGAVLVDDRSVQSALWASFDTLAKEQTDLGVIPNNVDSRSLKPNYRAYADGGLWFTLGLVVYHRQTGDRNLLDRYADSVRKVLSWCAFQDGDQSGLVSISEASDWQDLFAVRDKGLYVNVLYSLALEWASAQGTLFGDPALYAARAATLREKINEHLWYRGDRKIWRHVPFGFGTGNFDEAHMEALGEKAFLPEKRLFVGETYYLPYLTFRGFGEWFDSLGNLLSLLSGVADPAKGAAILDFTERHGLASPYPIKAIHPPVSPGDPDWREYYRFGNLNLPHQYHNGGIWPFLGGFYVAALVKAGRQDKAGEELEKLASMNAEGGWSFNEWFHGETGEARGMQRQAWSAGMYIYAFETVKAGRALFFE
jgi:glycogen debranching enzyme